MTELPSGQTAGWLILGLAFWMGHTAAGAPVPLAQAHAHNDYEHPRPLLDALAHGFCSVEADIYLVDGQLLVAHLRSQVKADRTLQALYLDPLRQRVNQNGGKVFPGGPTFTLLIDIKSDPEPTWEVLAPILHQYREMLTRFNTNSTVPGAVSVILSGNRPRHQLVQEPSRLAALDGRLDDLDSDESPHLVPLVSDNWPRHFRWRGTEPFPAEEKDKLGQLVKRAHAQGRRIRFWGTPDRVEVWRQLQEAGVDLLNTDNLDGMTAFLRQADAQAGH